MSDFRFEQNTFGVKTIKEVNAVDLEEIFEEFDLFLKGCGFVYDGQAGIVENILNGEPEDDEFDEDAPDLAEQLDEFNRVNYDL